MGFGFPEFRSSFLQTVCKAFDSRSKALRHHKKVMLECETGPKSGFEWLSVRFTILTGQQYVFYFDENNHISVLVAINGKVVFESEPYRIFADSDVIIRAVERTMVLSLGFKSGRDDSQISDAIRAELKNSAVRVI